MERSICLLQLAFHIKYNNNLNKILNSILRTETRAHLGYMSWLLSFKSMNHDVTNHCVMTSVLHSGYDFTCHAKDSFSGFQRRVGSWGPPGELSNSITYHLPIYIRGKTKQSINQYCVLLDQGILYGNILIYLCNENV